MQHPPQGELHPLLLQPDYWRGRLEASRATRPFVLITPRPDLSTPGCEVQEIRFRAHDGARLWGLMGRCPILRDLQPASLRLVGACELPHIDVDLVQEGRTEFVVQVPAGRRLVDRVLDAIRLKEVAANFDRVDRERVEFDAEDDEHLPDEVRIADELDAGGLVH